MSEVIVVWMLDVEKLMLNCCADFKNWIIPITYKRCGSMNSQISGKGMKDAKCIMICEINCIVACRPSRCTWLISFFLFSVDNRKGCYGTKKQPYSASWIKASLIKECTSNFSIPFSYAGLSAFTGESSNGPGSERRSHWRSQEQARCCDQGEICHVVSVLHDAVIHVKCFSSA